MDQGNEMAICRSLSAGTAAVVVAAGLMAAMICCARAQESYHLAAGDKITVTVYGQPQRLLPAGRVARTSPLEQVAIGRELNSYTGPHDPEAPRPGGLSQAHGHEGGTAVCYR